VIVVESTRVQLSLRGRWKHDQRVDWVPWYEALAKISLRLCGVQPGAQARIPVMRLPALVERFVVRHTFPVTAEMRGTSAGLDPRRVPYNMGRRRHQPERDVHGDNRWVATATKRLTLVVKSG
jgi:hypothetical protein